MEMTPEQCAATLTEVSATVLEEAAFVFTEPASGTLSWSGDIVETKLTFSGDGNGTVMLAAPQSVGLELAANLLGLEPGEETHIERPAEAALAEILNMIAGPLTARLFGDTAVCRIGVPMAKTVPGSAHENWSRRGFCSVSLTTEENDPIELAVALG
jgi:CheY-specific phosphatase CheX